MKSKTLLMVGAICVLVSACAKQAPTSPDSGNVAPLASNDARSPVTQAAPRPVSPVVNAEVKNSSQPVTLVVANGLSVASGKTPSYTFEVATDAAFTKIAFSKVNVAEGTGQTSLTLAKLPPDQLYYWRARPVVGSVDGPNSVVRAFHVGPEVILQTPVQTSPGDGAVAGAPVTLIAANVQTSGPAGPISYQFDVSGSPAFDSLSFTTTVSEGGNGQTAATVTARLTPNTTYYWRVRALDGLNDVTTPYSATRAFKPQTFDPLQAVFHDNPPDIGFWPETAKITSIVFTPGAILVDFDRRDGPNRWPDVPFGTGDLQYTLGMCLNIAGRWNCSAVVQFWYGRDLQASGSPSDINFEWFYDPGRWRDLYGRQPADGETVAIFVVSGDARNNKFTRATCPRVCERSDFVLVPFSRFGGVSYP